MKLILKIIKYFFMILLSIIAFIAISVIITINVHPSFGWKLTDELRKLYSSSVNFKDTKFINIDELDVAPKISFKEAIKNLPEILSWSGSKNTLPAENIKVEKIDVEDVKNFKNWTRFFWIGHSSFLLQMDEKNILLDPVFGERPSPISWLGGKRFTEELPIQIEDLPNIDAVLISHDHYDHLDYDAIKKLKEKTSMFYVPLGVWIHLKKWWIEDEKIVELDWWDDSEYQDLKFTFAPAQHRSWRNLDSTDHTLWGSWAIKSEDKNIYFSGDSWYGPHYKEIWKNLWPFDFAMMECWQYSDQWTLMHMFPEETAQAGVDIWAKQIMPIHWWSFRISDHAWNEPPQRVKAAAEKLNLPVIIPKIGEAVEIKDPIDYSNETWWENN